MVGEFPSKLMKEQWFPRPHNFAVRYSHGLETAQNNTATIVPLIMYDEGLGTPSDYESNPENANFVTASEPNCYPNSRINRMTCQLEFRMTKDALETDKLHYIKCAFMPITHSFIESYTAIDELSQNEVQDIIETQTESTDRQGYPLFNGVDMLEPVTNSANLPTNVPGLTTDQGLEGVTFDPNYYYGAIQYYTNREKIKKVAHGLKWFVLTKDHPVKRIKVILRSRSKRMVPYSFTGVMTYIPPADNAYQLIRATDTTNVGHVDVTCRAIFNEWNQDFNHKAV